MARLKTADLFRDHIESLGIHLPFDEELLSGLDSPLGQPHEMPGGRVN